MSGTDNQGNGEVPSHSTRPYLVRAIYQWALDNGLTPQILVNTSHREVQVPSAYIRDHRIVLNIHPQSVSDLELGNEYLMFSARFSGSRHELIVPVDSIQAVYAREDGQGIVFQEATTGDDDDPGTETDGTNKDKRTSKSSAPRLTLVK